ncbi:retinol dehydrogenase 11-like [Sitophilus oryzae]|uniref:Retinol dehydrogenase 11-like n=1 Tax=Sitophilus oryzae TaxID=7048 RepID=A0A6J2YIV7_SITOR|nr:retinol dehydrogenase 11-like [Sitophilus oryzae]
MYRLAVYILPFLLLVVIRKYRERKWGKCLNKVKLDGKTVLITGANSGIGYEVAKELASRSAQVILACRTMEKANLTITKLQESLENTPDLIPMAIDLGSLESVKEFASLVRKSCSKIDIMINNAGVAYRRSDRLKTQDGFEIHFGVNHLGHFYLTLLLEDLVAKAKGRIVVVTSSLLEKGKVDLNAIKKFNFEQKVNLYANSKLANVYFAQELARRTKDKEISVYAVCPGWVYTGLFRHSFRWYHYFFAPVAFLFMRSPKQGAQTVIYCATEPTLDQESGLIYRDCMLYNSRIIFFDKLARDLWSESENMISSVIKNQ